MRHFDAWRISLSGTFHVNGKSIDQRFDATAQAMKQSHKNISFTVWRHKLCASTAYRYVDTDVYISDTPRKCPWRADLRKICATENARQ
jgi:hypothetical protein